MAVVTALAHIDVPTGEFQRIVWFQPFDRLRGFGLEEQRHDFDEATDTDHDRDEYGHQADVLFNDFMRHCVPLLRRSRSRRYRAPTRAVA
jgi:hypothetical protein